ncbi:ferritin-like domain-containing protein [Corallococcus sp. bb12-1]|uniref:ferritin-like domain-containing protein n=1 Tax=Corallococcus sp. bb12-1 TaxID=2996784 RepID=UPI0022701E76|nr:ferritin-like domain-containing protein [Corallococcus sp. bb12-1]MCY1040728.1 ferritin-like domain-containing protein [Corallococcus sp. bb12-1]
MNARRLRHLFSRALRTSLATPLVLAGCGSDAVDLEGYAPIACDDNVPAVSDLTLSPQPDYLQLRLLESYQEPPSFDGTATSGTACATASDVPACQEALAATLPEEGFHHSCFQLCADYFLATTRGDEVKTYSTLEALKGLLGTIDTAQEATLVAFAAGYQMSCGELERGAVKQNAEGTFNVIGTRGYSCGEGTQVTQHVLEVSASGEVRELEQHVVEKGTGACGVGRRPVGLQVAGACESPDALGRYFAEVAHLEAASIHAFLRLRKELALHGAGPDLQAAALASAVDEVLHADVTGRLARRFGATPPSPTVTELPERPLAEVARDNAVEGCVRETYGALVAHHQALHARDTGVREAMARIAEDETRHAGLSWDIDRWVRPRLSAQERDALREAQRRAVALLREEVAAPLDAGLVTEAGLPTPKVALALLDTLEQELWG